MIEEKNLQTKKYQLGQFFTPPDLSSLILETISNIDSEIIVEPSFGDCGFIGPLLVKYPKTKIVGVEIDIELYNKGIAKYPNTQLFNLNFYDTNNEFNCASKKVSFVGNVPFRSPAYSLTTHGKYVKQLAHKYGVTGIREEAVFFIIKTADLMITHQFNGGIHYIIPKSLITNDSKFYKKFKLFLKNFFKITSVIDVDPTKFDNVAQGLVMLSLQIGGNNSNYLSYHNGNLELVDDIIQLNSSDIPFQDIFKTTYLGSVPAESFLMSSADETKFEFKNRLAHIFATTTTVQSLLHDLASSNGKYHLRVLNNSTTDKVNAKVSQICNYINTIKQNVPDLTIFSDISNYCEIQHRKEKRFYFRNKKLKKCGFVYELNPNPQPSFYFTSNPSSNSTDYFGYCEFDVNRNSSPGCCRTVPISGIANNLTPAFKTYWDQETNKLPYELVFSYIKYISTTVWFKEQKKIRRRFYFCLPKIFNKDWLLNLDQSHELSVISQMINARCTITQRSYANTDYASLTNFTDAEILVQQSGLPIPGKKSKKSTVPKKQAKIITSIFSEEEVDNEQASIQNY